MELIYISLSNALLGGGGAVNSGAVTTTGGTTRGNVRVIPMANEPLSNLPRYIGILPNIRCTIASGNTYMARVTDNEQVCNTPLSGRGSLRVVGLLGSRKCLFRTFTSSINCVRPTLVRGCERGFANAPINRCVFNSHHIIPSAHTLFRTRGGYTSRVFVGLPGRSRHSSLTSLLTTSRALNFYHLRGGFLRILRHNASGNATLRFLYSCFGVNERGTTTFNSGSGSLPLLTTTNLPITVNGTSRGIGGLTGAIARAGRGSNITVLLTRFWTWFVNWVTRVTTTYHSI